MNTGLKCFRVADGARFSVIGFPCAGGNENAFREWPRHLPADVGVYAARYPGRQGLLSVQAARSLTELADPLAQAVSNVPGPVVAFGHSMGALVAHAVTTRLEKAGCAVRALAICGREAPHLVSRIPTSTDDDSLLAVIGRLGGIDQALLADPEMREIVLTPLRADIAILNGEIGRTVQPVSAPVLAYVGINDPGCTVDDIEGWRRYTTGSFRRCVLPGDHFSLVSEPARLLADLADHV